MVKNAVRHNRWSYYYQLISVLQIVVTLRISLRAVPFSELTRNAVHRALAIQSIFVEMVTGLRRTTGMER
jgi:hypothetical protein